MRLKKARSTKEKKMRNAFTYCIYTQIKTDICLKWVTSTAVSFDETLAA